MSVFASISESERSIVAEFLTSVFRTGSEGGSFRADTLRWKYFLPHPQWQKPRSYAVKRGDKLVAHGGIWPLCFDTGAAAVNAIHLIDWAAAKEAPGAGISLLRKMATMADILLTIGGSSDTRAILPKLGYRRTGELRFYARVVRPWRQFRTSPKHNWKAPLRLARNTLWSLNSIRAPENWEAVQIPEFGDSQQALVGYSPATILHSMRTPSILNYMLSCPATVFSGFLILADEKQCGYFMLARSGGQTRIVEIRLNREDHQSWLAACKLATCIAAHNPATCEISAATSQESIATALQEIGFRLRRSDPVYCYDPRKHLANAPPMSLSMLDGDACFLSDPDRPYLT